MSTLSKSAATRYFDLLGAGLALEEPFVTRAKRRAFELLQPRRGERLLNVGVGPGREQQWMQDAVAPGIAVGMDMSVHMLGLARSRTGSRTLCRADAEHLPFRDAAFDAIFSAYMLDLFSETAIAATFAEFRRVLGPGGRLAVVSMTRGTTVPSRMLVAAWNTVFAVAPWLLGGCRPIPLAAMVEAAGFQVVAREIVVQKAAPSEVVLAHVPSSGDKL